MTEKRSHQSLFYFLPLYYLTKSCKGVHFRQGGVHFLIIPKNTSYGLKIGDVLTLEGKHII